MNEEKKENDLNEVEGKNELSEEMDSNEESKLDKNDDITDANNEDQENIKEDVADDNIESTNKELDETKDKLLRVLAENENIRKQSEKNRLDLIKYGVQPLARELVNVVDNFERATNNVTDLNKEKILEGFELIHREIMQILEKFNIKKIDALGQSFDANLHQAMFEKPVEDMEPGIVCEVVQEGYHFHDRLLRPAMVGISKKLEKEEENKREVSEQPDESPPKNDSN